MEVLNEMVAILVVITMGIFIAVEGIQHLLADT